MISLTLRRPVYLLVVAGLLSYCGDGGTAWAEDPGDPIREAAARIAKLKNALRSKGLANEDILLRLTEAHEAIHAVEPPSKPDLESQDPGADPALSNTVAEENARRLERWAREVEAFQEREERLRRRWVASLEEALAAHVRDPRTGLNARLDVNRRAIELLVATERPDAATVVARALHRSLNAGPDVQWSLLLTGPLIDALERLRSLEALDLLRQLVSSRDRLLRLDTLLKPSSWPGGGRPLAPEPETLEYDYQVRFLRVIGSYHGVPGQLRYLLVRDLIATYEPMEAAIAHSNSAYTMWTKIGAAAVDAAWRHAGKPAGDAGVPLASMKELAEWFMRNRSRAGQAWRD